MVLKSVFSKCSDAGSPLRNVVVLRNGGIRVDLLTDDHVALLQAADLKTLLGGAAHAHQMRGDINRRKVVVCGVPEFIDDASLRQAFTSERVSVDAMDRRSYTRSSNVFVILDSIDAAQAMTARRSLFVDAWAMSLRVEKPTVR